MDASKGGFSIPFCFLGRRYGLSEDVWRDGGVAGVDVVSEAVSLEARGRGCGVFCWWMKDGCWFLGWCGMGFIFCEGVADGLTVISDVD